MKARNRKCSIEDCARKHLSRGYCSMHYQRWSHGYDIGGPAADPRTGDRTRVTRPLMEWSDWWTKDDGYRERRRRIAPGRYESQLEHRFVMEQALGRPLLRSENVHHRNGVRDDNRRSNLELWSTMQPQGKRPADLVAFAREVLGLYGDMELAA